MTVNSTPSATTAPTPSVTAPVWRTSAADASLLLQAALVGSSQSLQLPSYADPNDPVAQLLRQIPQDPNSSNTGNHLLRLAGTWGWCKRAGYIPSTRPREVETPNEAQTLSAPPAEMRPVAPPAWVVLLQEALSLDQPSLQAEVLQGMNQMQYRAPTEYLSALLHLGRQTTAMRPFIQPVLGERGRWLGKHNRDWTWAQGAEENADIETLWTDGNLEQRLQVLKTQRLTDPMAARERLMVAWSSLPAKERQSLLDTFRWGLNAEDEAFLDLQLQKDRSSEVRRTAADLLAALPQSAYSQRMVQRLTPLVQVENHQLLIQAPPEPAPPTDATGHPIVGTHPTQLPNEAALKTDWPDAERTTYESLGPRAWLLYQFVRRSSLQWWTTHTGLTPTQLLKQAQKSDWAEALIRGWLHACTYQADPEWILALLQHGKTKHWGDVEQLLSQLPQEARDDYQLHQWSADTADTDRKKLLKQAANLFSFLQTGLEHISPHGRWSERLSAYVASVLKTAIKEQAPLKGLTDNYHDPERLKNALLGQDANLNAGTPERLMALLLKGLEHNHYNREKLLKAACALQAQHLPVLQSLPVHLDDQNSSVNDCLRSIYHIVRLRLKLQELLTAPETAA